MRKRYALMPVRACIYTCNTLSLWSLEVTISFFKSHIWETLNLLTSVDSSRDTKTHRKGQGIYFFMLCVMSHMLCMKFQVSCVMCSMLRVTCHLSLTLKDEGTDLKTQRCCKTQKNLEEKNQDLKYQKVNV